MKPADEVFPRYEDTDVVGDRIFDVVYGSADGCFLSGLEDVGGERKDF